MLRSLTYIFGIDTALLVSAFSLNKKETRNLLKEEERLFKSRNTVLPSRYTDDLKIFDGMSIHEATGLIDELDERKFQGLFTRIKNLFFNTPGSDYEIYLWRNRERIIWRSMQMRMLNELFVKTEDDPYDDFRTWCFTINSWRFGLEDLRYGPFYFKARTNHLPFLPAVGGTMCIWDCFDDYLKEEIMTTILTNTNFLSTEFLTVISVEVSGKRIRVTLEK